MSAAYINNLVALIAIFSILGISFNLLMGHTGLFAISHGAFFGFGAYTTAILMRDHGWTFPLAALGGALVCLLVGLIVGLAAGRVADFYLVIMTLGLQVAAVELFSILDITGGSSGLVGIPRLDLFGFELSNQLVAIFSLIVAVLVLLYVRLLIRSPFGRALETVRENPLSAGALGLSVTWTKVRSFAISAALAGIAGALFAVQLRYISPHEFGLERSIEVLSLVIIGGLGTLLGPFVGAIVVVAVPAALSFLDLPASIVGAMNSVMFSGIVLLFLLFLPQGIVGGRLEERLFRRLRRARADSDDSLVETASLFGDIKLRPVRLECEDVSVSFGGVKAVDSVSLRLEPGAITGLVGPNGAGKTTLFNILTGVVRPTSGEVRIDGELATRLPIHIRARRQVVRSFQDMKLFSGMTVENNVLAAMTPASDLRMFLLWLSRRSDQARQQQARKILAALGLEPKRGVLAKDLSYAEQKLLMLARLFATGASCFLLDEPMSGLDTAARERIQQILLDVAEAGGTICLVEHSLDVISSTCTRVAFLAEGRLVREGDTREITTDPELVDTYFGV